MEAIRLEIQTNRDKKTGNKIVDRLEGGEIIPLEETTAGIIQDGTEGGQEAIMFAGKTPGGDWAVIQITTNHFNAIASALKGAQIRFKMMRG